MRNKSGIDNLHLGSGGVKIGFIAQAQGSVAIVKNQRFLTATFEVCRLETRCRNGTKLGRTFLIHVIHVRFEA
ncbi:hypothetical protein [Siphonobacter sp. BAB-5385]|uniref:hypothetical protein n=1 Tax=Siphonobacter sp. BAB-5385 TaxID=1864822 RepID=UPI001C3D39D1|nr:hypothetical protein [Siphonobacter sp. BAB-5385]